MNTGTVIFILILSIPIVLYVVLFLPKAVAEFRKRKIGEQLSQIFKFVFGVIIILSLSYWGVSSIMTRDTSSDSETRVEKIDDKTPSAYIQAQRFVKVALKSPSTAVFPLTAYTQEVEPSRFISQGHVDAQNSFGATIRSQFVVVLRYTGAESYEALSNGANWKLEELILDNQVMYPAQ